MHQIYLHLCGRSFVTVRSHFQLYLHFLRLSFVTATMVGWMVFHIIIALVTYAFFPKLTNAIPASLAAIIMTTIFEHALVRPVGYRTNCVSDLAEVSAQPFLYHGERNPTLLSKFVLLHSCEISPLLGCWYFPRTCLD